MGDGDGNDVSCDDGLDQQGMKIVIEQEKGLVMNDDGDYVSFHEDQNLQNQQRRQMSIDQGKGLGKMGDVEDVSFDDDLNQENQKSEKMVNEQGMELGLMDDVLLVFCQYKPLQLSL